MERVCRWRRAKSTRAHSSTRGGAAPSRRAAGSQRPRVCAPSRRARETTRSDAAAASRRRRAASVASRPHHQLQLQQRAQWQEQQWARRRVRMACWSLSWRLSRRTAAWRRATTGGHVSGQQQLLAGRPAGRVARVQLRAAAHSASRLPSLRSDARFVLNTREQV